MTQRCNRNRKRSKRRAIFCPTHGCYLDSVSQKYSIYADRAEQLQQRGVTRRNALMLVSNQTAVPLTGEWLEEFWCEDCQATVWYHVRKQDQVYSLSVAPVELWQQATGVIHPSGNPSVGEFTRRQARCNRHNQIRDFQFVV